MFALTAVVPSGAVMAQSGSVSNAAPADSAIGAEQLERYVKAHLALLAFRSQLQGELADPRAKKDDVQKTLREKLRAGTQRILGEHKFSEPEFARLTKRVASDDAVRKAFEEQLAKAPKGGG
jgi:hypothetical protein